MAKPTEHDIAAQLTSDLAQHWGDPLFSFAHEAAPDPRDRLLKEAFNSAADPSGPTRNEHVAQSEHVAAKLQPPHDLDRAEMGCSNDVEQDNEQELGR